MLPYVKGTTYTPWGAVSVSWQKTLPTSSLNATLPGDVTASFIRPHNCPGKLEVEHASGKVLSHNGRVVVVRGQGEYSFTC